MNTKTKTTKASTRKTQPTKQELRDRLFGDAPLKAAKTRKITLFGEKLELRQPSLGQILDVQDNSDSTKISSGKMIIEYTCIPGTNQRVFEDTDLEMILAWPFGEDLAAFNEAISDLVGVDVTKAEGDLKANPS